MISVVQEKRSILLIVFREERSQLSWDKVYLNGCWPMIDPATESTCWSGCLLCVFQFPLNKLNCCCCCSVLMNPKENFAAWLGETRVCVVKIGWEAVEVVDTFFLVNKRAHLKNGKFVLLFFLEFVVLDDEIFTVLIDSECHLVRSKGLVHSKSSSSFESSSLFKSSSSFKNSSSSKIWIWSDLLVCVVEFCLSVVELFSVCSELLVCFTKSELPLFFSSFT